MKTFYVVPTETITATKPRGSWHATPCPGTPALTFCVVESWNDDTADDDWEALPGVRPLHLEMWGQAVPAAAATALAPWGVLPTDTIRQAMQKVRKFFPAARH